MFPGEVARVRHGSLSRVREGAAETEIHQAIDEALQSKGTDPKKCDDHMTINVKFKYQVLL